jgi:DUF1680 family protein
MTYSTASFKTDKFLRRETQDAQMGGVMEKLIDFEKQNQIYNKILWARFVDVFTYPADVGDRGWRCEYWGKMMRGAASVLAYTHDEELYEILKGAVLSLLDTAESDGRISSYSRDREFDGWDMWGRKYVLLGLQYFCEVCPEQDVVDRCHTEMCRQLDYIIAHIGREEGKKPITSSSRHWLGANACSILEPVVRLYNATGKKQYLDFAEYIVDVCYGNEAQLNIFKTALEDKLDPSEYCEQKAYETMSCFEGLIEYYRLTGEEKHLTACLNFARRVLENEVSIIGCCGCTHELFDNTRLSQVDPNKDGIMQETCVSVTWMKFCGQLLRLTGDPRYADAIEQTFFNAFLGAVNFPQKPFVHKVGGRDIPEHIEIRGVLPFDSYSPLRVGRRGKQIGGMKLDPKGTFYGCCACISPMGIGTFAETAMLLSENGVVINSYMDGYLSAKGFKFHIESNYPYKGKVKITVEGDGELELMLRIPVWSRETALFVGGKPLAAESGYVKIDRTWKNGDLIELCLDDAVYPVLPPEDSPYKDTYIALRKGAIILALDKRICDPRAKVSLATSGKIEACELACDALPYYNLSLGVKETDGTLLHVIDYASAGSTFDEESECAAWLER